MIMIRALCWISQLAVDRSRGDFDAVSEMLTGLVDAFREFAIRVVRIPARELLRLAAHLFDGGAETLGTAPSDPVEHDSSHSLLAEQRFAARFTPEGPRQRVDRPRPIADCGRCVRRTGALAHWRDGSTPTCRRSWRMIILVPTLAAARCCTAIVTATGTTHIVLFASKTF